MNENMQRIMRRTYRYYYDDGLVEMAVGLLFLVVGLLLAAWVTVQSGSGWNIVIAIGLPILITGGTFGIQRAVRHVKERVTYRRTGYVSYRPGEPSTARWLLTAGALALIALSFILPAWLSQMPIAEGFLMGLVLTLIGYRVDSRRFYLLGITVLIISITVSASVDGDLQGSALTFSSSGLILILSGAITFGRYIKGHPDPDRQSHE